MGEDLKETTGSPAAPAPEAATAAEAPTRRKKGKKNVPRGIAHIRSTFNNTLITITDPKGDVIAWKTGGTMGFKGSRKGTPFAAQRAAYEITDACKTKFGLREIEIRVQGPGPGRETAIRGVQSAGVTIRSIEDVTPLPHNGCRPRKKRRV